MKIVKVIITSATVLLSATPAYAISQTITSPVGNNITTVNQLVGIVFNILIGLVGALAVIFIIIGAIRYILARGDAKATDAARGTITAALIGLVIAILAILIVNVITGLFGASGINPTNIGY